MNDRKYMNLLNRNQKKGHMAKAVALAMCFALFTTSVDVMSFAFIGDAGLDIKDIYAIGGDASTPVVKVVTSNKSVGLLKSQMIRITFDTTRMTVKYKPKDTVYLYNGTSKAGVGCSMAGKVDKNGKVSFYVPMVSSYWTIGSKNLGSRIMKR